LGDSQCKNWTFFVALRLILALLCALRQTDNQTICIFSAVVLGAILVANKPVQLNLTSKNVFTLIVSIVLLSPKHAFSHFGAEILFWCCILIGASSFIVPSKASCHVLPSWLLWNPSQHGKTRNQFIVDILSSELQCCLHTGVRDFGQNSCCHSSNKKLTLIVADKHLLKHCNCNKGNKIDRCKLMCFDTDCSVILNMHLDDQVDLDIDDTLWTENCQRLPDHAKESLCFWQGLSSSCDAWHHC